MYFPFFRGKQYELITIRETAQIIADNNFTPIIEPVKSQLRGLQKSLDILCEVGANVIVIVNPTVGDFANNGEPITDLLELEYEGRDNIYYGLMLTERDSTDSAVAFLNEFDSRNFALIHNGFADGVGLSHAINECNNVNFHVFLDDKIRYRRHFREFDNRVMVQNGFERRRNRDHPDTEFFSELHLTYQEELNMDGFGDFSIAGDGYSESGGPAYTVAIHLTYIDETNEDEMFIKHFKSIRQNSPQDPAGKFGEALERLIQSLDSDENQIIESSSIAVFRDLYERGHYPGLGFVKKLSMIHHIETIANYFDED